MQTLKHNFFAIQPVVNYEHQLHYPGSLGTGESNKKKFQVIK